MRKQPNSRYCFLCGFENPIGLKLAFYDDGERVQARFEPGEEHQGFPGVLHGGITSALLDETIGRALVRDDIWAMTVELSVRFLKPIPLDAPLTVVGWVERLRSRTMEGRGEVRLADGSLAAAAEARYIRLTDDQLAPFRAALDAWRVYERDEPGAP